MALPTPSIETHILHNDADKTIVAWYRNIHGETKECKYEVKTLYLCDSSSYFRAMLRAGNFKEGNTNEDVRFEVSSFSAFYIVLCIVHQQ